MLLIQAPVTPEFGILFLGIFVGAILGYGLVRTGGNLKAALTVLGAALGSGPILFISEVQDARWTYPVGLVLGMLLLRVVQARAEIADARKKKTHKVFAWIDIAIIIAVTLAAAIWSAIRL